ncbi:MAG: CotH kinase family protein [Acidobacteria bacterium]|nr:CotH kinase family protein [Acidobacteriota bacterium]
MILFCLMLLQAPNLYELTHITDIEVGFNQSDWEEQLHANHRKDQINKSSTYLKASVTVQGLQFPHAGMRIKGNSSYVGRSSTRNSLAIKLDAFGQGDFAGIDLLTLNAGKFDESLCAELLAYRLLGQHMIAPRANWAWLHVNGIDYGIFVNVERIDKQFMKRNFGSGKRHRYKPNKAGLEWLGGDVEHYAEIYALKSGSQKEAHQDVLRVSEHLHDWSKATVKNLSRVFAITEAIDYLVLTDLMAVWDDYRDRHNYYLCEDSKGRLHIVPWDMDRAFSHRFDRPLGIGVGVSDLPLLDILCVRELEALYIKQLHRLSRQVYSEDTRVFLDSCHAILQPEMAAACSPEAYEKWELAFVRFKSYIERRGEFVAYDLNRW